MKKFYCVFSRRIFFVFLVVECSVLLEGNISSNPQIFLRKTVTNITVTIKPREGCVTFSNFLLKIIATPQGWNSFFIGKSNNYFSISHRNYFSIISFAVAMMSREIENGNVLPANNLTINELSQWCRVKIIGIRINPWEAPALLFYTGNRLSILFLLLLIRQLCHFA